MKNSASNITSHYKTDTLTFSGVSINLSLRILEHLWDNINRIQNIYFEHLILIVFLYWSLVLIN